MILDTRIVESDLRSHALAGSIAHALVLADFYEEHGQPSRAKLWRKFADGRIPIEPSRFWHGIPDLLVPDVGPHGKCDPRRNSMIGLLSFVEKPSTLARLFELSTGRICQIIERQAERIRYNVSHEIKKASASRGGMPAVRRLIAARALGTPGVTPSGHVLPYTFGEDPPASWPASRPHEIERLAKRKETP